MPEPASPQQLGVPSKGLGRKVTFCLSVAIVSCACWIMSPAQGDTIQVRLWMSFNQTPEEERMNDPWVIPVPASTLPPNPLPQSFDNMNIQSNDVPTDPVPAGPVPTGPVPSPSLDALIAALKWQTPNWAEKLWSEHWKPSRYGGAKAWAEVDAVIDKAGHRRCGTARDSWSCNGIGYARELNKTRLWNASFDLFRLPPGTQIIGFGNSMLAELVHTVICNHQWDIVMPSPDIRTNSVIAHSNSSNITLALISNDQDIDGSMKPSHPADLVRRANWRAHVFVVGSLNNKQEQNATWKDARRNLLGATSPDATIIDLPGKHTGDCCSTLGCGHSKGCENKFIPGHTCLPGPVLRYAEQLVHVMHQAVLKKDLTQSCLGVGLERPSYECV
mmetsp:Transcript_26769/g.62641  ORF Transcript_26769/g.62641 Transcript_26769/m.62641 type:complete len:388 (+) Transcript_26769:95-1258(+)